MRSGQDDVEQQYEYAGSTLTFSRSRLFRTQTKQILNVNYDLMIVMIRRFNDDPFRITH